MSRLNKQQQDLILDFYFRCGDEESINRGRDLIAANPEAAKLYDHLESTLKELDAVKYEPCPDNLVEVVITRLKQAASQVAQGPLEHEDSTPRFALSDLIRAEQNKPNIPFAQGAARSKTRISRHRLAEIAAIAAVFLAISGIGFPVFSNLRQSSWKTACLGNFGRLGQAITRYAGDHDGLLPSVPMEAGSPWNRIGDQGNENHSNTRHLWALVKLGYAPPADFVCPGDRLGSRCNDDSEAMAQLKDFRCHRNISYSYQLLCGRNNLEVSRFTILLGDRNPLFENVCSCCNPADRTRMNDFLICLDPGLLARMSSNHRGLGQNILRRDGSAVFVIDRQIAGDDIFTLKDIFQYRGVEVPCSDGLDNFLAP
jgi:hypothetical protein